MHQKGVSSLTDKFMGQKASYGMTIQVPSNILEELNKKLNFLPEEDGFSITENEKKSFLVFNVEIESKIQDSNETVKMAVKNAAMSRISHVFGRVINAAFVGVIAGLVDDHLLKFELIGHIDPQEPDYKQRQCGPNGGN